MAMTDTTAINDPRFTPEVDPMFEYYIVEKPRLTYESPEDGPLTRAFVRVLEGFLGRHEMEAHYQRLKGICLLYTSPSPRDISGSRMPSSA